MDHRVRIKWMLVGVISLVGWSLSGCDTGPTRYPLSGKATYRGTPIPAGWISLEPVDVAATKETIGEAEIKDGQYKTRPGKGVVGGKHKVFITAGNGIPEPGSGPYGPSIFRRTYETTVDFGEEPSTYDFEVPASHAPGPAWPLKQRSPP